ncbi:MAG: biopolymer transporter ExbD [Kiritimatiellia bacterium]
MSRFRSFKDNDGDSASIDVSPLMDCVFILLIFFIVTTTFVDESGVEVDKPQAAASMNKDSSSIMLILSEKGKVFYSNREIGLGGVRNLVSNQLAKEMQPVIIQAAESVPAGILVRVVDKARLAGAEKVSVGAK